MHRLRPRQQVQHQSGGDHHRAHLRRCAERCLAAIRMMTRGVRKPEEEHDDAKRCAVEDPVQLMERVRMGDARAFERLYDAYARLVYGVALRVLADIGAAEDVTQAVFLKLWSAPDAFRSGNFAGWIARVARNRALDARRRNARGTVPLSESLPDDAVPEDSVFAAIDANRVRTALAKLTAEQREPIELGFFSGLTHDAIARQTGVPLGTVKTRIRSGLQRLRALLDETVTA